MVYPAGNCRIGPIRTSLSNYSPILPRTSSGSRPDDKNVETDGSVDKTNSFIVVLLLLILALCGVLKL